MALGSNITKKCSSISPFQFDRGRWGVLWCLCLCPPISWPADTFDSVCVHPSLDMQTLLTVFVSTFECLCHPSHDLQTHLTVFVSIHLMTCRYIWQHGDLQTHWTVFVSPISWPADAFDCGPYCHLTTQNFLFLFSTNFVQGTIWYWCHYVVFQAAWQCHALHTWYLNLPMPQRAAEHLCTTKSPRQLQTTEQEINWLSVWLSWGDPVQLTGHSNPVTN